MSHKPRLSKSFQQITRVQLYKAAKHKNAKADHYFSYWKTFFEFIEEKRKIIYIKDLREKDFINFYKFSAKARGTLSNFYTAFKELFKLFKFDFKLPDYKKYCD